jgi:hypothetical protein
MTSKHILAVYLMISEIVTKILEQINREFKNSRISRNILYFHKGTF